MKEKVIDMDKARGQLRPCGLAMIIKGKSAGKIVTTVAHIPANTFYECSNGFSFGVPFDRWYIQGNSITAAEGSVVNDCVCATENLMPIDDANDEEVTQTREVEGVKS